MKSMDVDGHNEVHQSYMNIDYSSGHHDDSEYTSLNDMIDVDMNSNIETLYPQMVVSAGKPEVTSSSTEMFSPPVVHTSVLPPIASSQANNIDLDSSVSNLSWLHSLQQQIPEANGNPNLMVNPQTGVPVSSTNSPQSVRVVTLPSNVHISNSSNIKYVSVPSSKQQVYISANKSLVSSQQLSTRPNLNYQRSYSHSPGSAPSSTVPDNPYPKPAYSYSCLIAMSLKNSPEGRLPVAEIYNFMMTNFPYFKTAPDGWKNSVRHNLSLNKCFEKIENPNSDGTHSRKGCLWGMNQTKIKKMDEEIAKWNKKDLLAIKRSMANPDILDMLTKGQGRYLMGKSNQMRHSYHTTQMSHRPGIRIVTAIQTPNSGHHQHITIGQGQILEHQQASDQIDLDKLADDAADLFGDHGALTIDPSLSDLTLQGGVLEELQGDMFDLPSMSHSPPNYMASNTKLASPMTSPVKSQMYNPSAVLPIY